MENTNENTQNETFESTPSSLEENDAETPETTEKPKRKGKGRRKIDIKYIHEKTKRQVTFSKRKAGLMKKAYELSTLTGTQTLVLVTSETGHVYTFATKKFQPFITDPEGKKLIQNCLARTDTPSQPQHQQQQQHQQHQQPSMAGMVAAQQHAHHLQQNPMHGMQGNYLQQHQSMLGNTLQNNALPNNGFFRQ